MKQEKVKETFAEIVAEMTDAYLEECVDHFLISRSRSMEDDGRYFYSMKELKIFKKIFESKGGDLNTLHIGIVYDESGGFLCYEICRKKYYDMATAYIQKKWGNVKNGERKIFFS